MAADLDEALGIEAELVSGARGAFEVFANDELIFSKLREERFPEKREIIEMLETRSS